MRLSGWVKLALTLWFIAEVIVFAAAVRVLGGPTAFLLSVLASLLGWALLKRAGASAIAKLRAAAGGRVAGPPTRHLLDDTLAAFGALALLLPGFLSDLVGLVLTVPAARRRLALWLGRTRLGARVAGSSPRRPQTIDLGPQDWTHQDEGPAAEKSRHP